MLCRKIFPAASITDGIGKAASLLSAANVTTDKLVLKGLDHVTEKRIFNYAKQYITPHLITEEHENDNEKI